MPNHGCFILIMANEITGLKLQKRNPNRVNVYIDGKFAFGAAKIVTAWLKVGDELDDKKLSKIKSEDEIETALQKAVHFINYRPRSIDEVSKRLYQKGVSQENIDRVTQRLTENGMLNDLDFANLWVENRSAFRPRGRMALRQELKLKGLSDEIIESALQNINEDQLAYDAAFKKATRFSNLEWKEFRKKLYGFLSRRGFNYEVISGIIPKVWEELSSTPDEDNNTNEVLT